MDSPPSPARGSSALTPVDLVRRAKAKNRSAIEALFARYLPRVRQIVSFRLGYGWRVFAACEDLVQDALLRIFQKLDALEERAEGTFRNWVAIGVANSVRNSLRKENRARPGGGRVVSIPESGTADTAALLLGHEPGPSTVYRGQELLDRIEKALLAMSDEHREAILLRKFCEMSYDEIARTLGVPSEAGARKAMSTALANLDERLAEDAG